MAGNSWGTTEDTFARLRRSLWDSEALCFCSSRRLSGVLLPFLLPDLEVQGSKCAQTPSKPVLETTDLYAPTIHQLGPLFGEPVWTALLRFLDSPDYLDRTTND